MNKAYVFATLAILAAPSIALAGDVTCSSTGRAQTFCDLDTHGEVTLVKQLSRAACKQDVSWGISKHGIWVSNGCRGVFHSTAGEEDDGGGAMSGAAKPGIPFANAECPGGVSIHADEGGPVYVNGKEAQVKRFNDNYYEASRNGVKYSINKNADGTVGVSYTGPGRDNGICTIQ